MKVVKNPKPEDVELAELREFYDLWHEIVGPGIKPLAPDLLLTSFVKHLDFIQWFKYHPDTNQFEAKFVGTGVVEATGVDFTGTYPDLGAETSALLERLQWVRENRKPILVTDANPTWSPKEFNSYSTLGCPIFDLDREVSGLLYKSHFSV